MKKSPLKTTENEPMEPLEVLRTHFDLKPKTLVLCHANPDGDALGAASAMFETLQNENVPTTVACFDAPGADFHFLPATKHFLSHISPKHYETIVFLDCGASYMTKFHEEHPEILEKDQFFIVNIDHHLHNEAWGDINIVWTDFASTTQMLLTIFEQISWHITPSVATSLLTGLYTDTGAFMHQNTTPEAYAAAAKLLKYGADHTVITENLFSKIPYRKLKLWGKVLQNVHLNSDQAAIVGVNESDYKDLGCTRADLAGVIDYVSAMPEADYAVVLSEDGRGNVKASLRTRKEGVNVQELAKKFGGGGHLKASGFTIPKGTLKREVKWKIVTEGDDNA